MLKSYSQHRSSPAASPVIHYAQSLPGSPLPRRASKSRAHTQKSTTPSQQKIQYVDASTQWSPRSIVKMEPPRAESTRIEATSDYPVPRASSATSPIVPDKQSSSPSKPLVEPESPALKRRGSQNSVPPATTAPDAFPAKRARTDQAPVKILPLKYEFCPVEDMVVLIANMIQELIQTNDNLPLRTGVLTRFHSR